MSKKEEKFCKCGEIIHPYYADTYDICDHCRQDESERKVSKYLRDLEVRLRLENDSITLITGGYDQDNDLQSFGDYYNTLTRMKGKLEEKGCKPPFTIISQIEVYNHAGSGNNFCFIAKDFDIDIEMKELWDIETTKGVIKEVAVNERDYILSRNWIKGWMIKENLGNYEYSYRLILTDGKKAIVTGSLILT